jgi:hypothetical protein
MPDALCQALKARVEGCGWEFHPSIPENPLTMRLLLVAYARQQRDVVLPFAGGMTPAQTVLDDYVYGNQPIRDPVWEQERRDEGEGYMHQHVTSFEEYLEAMSSPTASFDELMISLAAMKWKVRVVVLSQLTRLGEEEGGYRWHVQGDYRPPAVRPDRYIVLVHTPGHFKWAHPEGFRCGECGDVSTRLTAHLECPRYV